MTFSLTNESFEDIDSIKIQYNPKGGDISEVTHIFPTPVKPQETRMFSVDGFKCSVAGKEVYGEFHLTGVNGKPNFENSSPWLWVTCAYELFPKATVVEEYGRNSCGNCARGYIAMEHMRSKYTDGTWIGIAVQTEGVMYHGGCYSEHFAHISGIPKCVVNRDYDNVQGVHPDIFEDVYNTARKFSTVGLSAESKYNAETKSCEINVSFRSGLDSESNNPYSLAYIITEDSIGPYFQSNYYSGGALGPMFGWEDKESYVSVIFNDIATSGSITNGVDGSLPTEVMKQTDYCHTQTLSCEKVTDINNSFVTVMVLENTSGKIENAIRIPIMENETVAISDIETDHELLETELYTLQGIKVKNTTTVKSGIYIQKNGNTIKKVILP